MVRASKATVKAVRMNLIDRPKEGIRMEVDPERIDELAASIDEQGLLQPIVLRKAGDRYEIVAGDRRYLAHEKLGRTHITATVREMSDVECALARATENLTRADLTPLEEAAIYFDLLDNRGLTPEQIGKQMGKKAGTIIRRMQILKMALCLQKAVHEKKVSVSAAEELAVIKDIASLEYYLECAVEHGATKDVCRLWAKDWKDSQRRKDTAGEGGSLPQAPFESKPIYITCDTCLGAMELGQEVVLRVCQGCAKSIKDAISQ